MQDRFKFRIIIEKDFKTINGKHKGQIIYYCNGFIQTKLKTYFFGNNKKLSFLNSQVKSINQCTGLKDKNGKLIYEGDIVNQIYEDETIYKCEVVYNNCSFQLKHIEDKYKNNINTPMYCYAINYLGHYTEKRLEVIGNIYENKELLNESECKE